jgi:hypothetical protein
VDRGDIACGHGRNVYLLRSRLRSDTALVGAGWCAAHNRRSTTPLPWSDELARAQSSRAKVPGMSRRVCNTRQMSMRSPSGT